MLETEKLTDVTQTETREGLAGRQFGPYRVKSLLGSGGMGQVYRAHDDKLGRDVAIKTVAPQFADDADLRARFRREARALAALNHPNIAAIYGLEESPEGDYLVLELVEGDTPRGPLPVATALDYARQIADALHAAHEHGIIHRDLKPANLKITPQGSVKVLDFGLAKAILRAEGKHDEAQHALTASATAVGHVVGTAAYMSPEQARGRTVDQRTDIWAFGCVVYELLAGRRVFECGTYEQTIAAVLQDEPDWRGLPAGTPAKIRDLLRQCLQKDPKRRLNDVSEASAIIEQARRTRSRRTPHRPSGLQQGGRRSTASRIRTLAVLPLANLAGDPEQDYFADGMTEALIAELAQLHALDVISRTSVMHYKDTAKTVPEIGRELGVDGIIEGSVMRAGDRVRITAQLIHSATDRHLWARSYERDLRDVLALQSEVARAIADEIQVEVTPQERARLARPRPVNVESHEAYIRGRYHWGRVHPERSIEHFQRAIALDPQNALAYAGIADAQCMMFGGAMEMVPPAQVAPLARASALKALELDETLPEPHVALARVLFWHDRDAAGAERELRRAIQLNPSCALAYLHCGVLLGDVQRNDESVVALQRALQLDPVSCWNSAIAGWALYELGQEEMARQQLQKALDLDPSFFFTWTVLSLIHSYEAMFAQATEEAEEAVRLSAGLPLARGIAGYVMAMAGRRAEAVAALADLDDLSRHRYVPAAARVWTCIGLGDYDAAIEWMEVGYRERDSQLPHAAVYRAFKPLAPDARFQDLLWRLGITRRGAAS